MDVYVCLFLIMVNSVFGCIDITCTGHDFTVLIDYTCVVHIAEIDVKADIDLDCLFKDRYGIELQLTKNLLQQEFNDNLKVEKVVFSIFILCHFIFVYSKLCISVCNLFWEFFIVYILLCGCTTTGKM